MRDQLKDKVAIITGAGGDPVKTGEPPNIGRATAITFAKAGAKVFACDINPDTVKNKRSES